MDRTLKSILEKIAREKSTASLTDADYVHLARIVGGPGDEPKDGPTALWRFVRRKVMLNKGIFDSQFDSEVDSILVDAGASAENFKGYQPDVRRMALVTKEGLKRSVRRHLTNDSTSVRAHAARLVGLLELEDTAPTLVDSLESRREERSDYGTPVIAASLEALAMLGHPQTRAFAMRYVGHDDWTLRRSAQAAALVAEGVPTNEELKRIFETQFEPQLLVALPDVFVAAAKNGAFGEDELENMIENLPLYIHTCEAIADIVVSAEWKELYKKLLSHNDPDLRAALAVRIAWTKTTWAQPALRERLEEEDVQDTRLCIVAALGTLGDDALVKARLESDDAGDKMGAIWATIGTGKYREEIEKLTRDQHLQVRRAASAALAVNDAKTYDASDVDVKWTDLLNNEDEWWPWGLPLKGLSAIGVPLPVAADAFIYVSGDTGRFHAADLDRALGIFAKHPLHLLRWLRADVPASQRVRAIGFAGMIGEQFADALEETLLCTDRIDVAQAAALEIVAGRGPSNKAVELKTQLALLEHPKSIEGGLLPAAVFASSGDTNLRKRAATLLGSCGAEAEPYLQMLVGCSDAEVARAASEAVAQLASPNDALLADIARLLSGEARKLGDLPNLERLVVCLSPRVRSAIAELGALPDASKEDVMRLFPFLVADRDEDVAAAALGALAAQSGDARWVKDLVLSKTWSPQWRTREKAIAAMAQIADPMFVARMIEIAGEDDGSAKDNAVRGLERMAETHPELGLVVLDIRDPFRVVTRFGLNDRPNYEADKHTEGLRMLLLGLDKRKDEKEAKKHVGRKVMITQATDDSGSHATWPSSLFDQIAMNLRVVYTDDESGAIVAEVGEDPTGEVLSALLQNSSIAVRRLAWS
jgi:hypothetical protein